MALALVEAKYGWRYFTTASYAANLGGFEVISFIDSFPELRVWERDVNGRNFLILSTERDLNDTISARQRREARIQCHDDAIVFPIESNLPRPFGCGLFTERFGTCYQNHPNSIDFTHHACLRRGSAEGFMTTSKQEMNNELYLTDRFNTETLAPDGGGITERLVHYYFRVSTF